VGGRAEARAYAGSQPATVHLQDGLVVEGGGRVDLGLHAGVAQVQVPNRCSSDARRGRLHACRVAEETALDGVRSVVVAGNIRKVVLSGDVKESERHHFNTASEKDTMR